MDELIKELEINLHRAISPIAEDVDITALDSFTALIQRNPRLSVNAIQFLAVKIHSQSQKEALFALDVLEECMETCGEELRAEVNKFRFLNELIRLVSDNHLGKTTSKLLKDRVLDTLFTFTTKYPHQGKIRNAYDMLRSQGVSHMPQENIIQRPKVQQITRNSDVETVEKESKLKKLINSNNPNDRLAANLLIQSMVREDERRLKMKNQRILELEKVKENVKLLNEMLNHFKRIESSEDDLNLIKELFEDCKALHPTVIRLADETQQSEGMLDLTSEKGYKNLGLFWSLAKEFENILETNDSLTQVFEKYHSVIENPDTETHSARVSQTYYNNNTDLLSSLFDNSENIQVASLQLPAMTPVQQTLSTDDSMINCEDKILEDIFKQQDAIANNRNDDLLKDDAILTPQRVDRKVFENINQSNIFGTSLQINSSPMRSRESSKSATQQKNSQFEKVIPDLDSIINGIKSSLLPQAEVNIQGDCDMLQGQSITTQNNSITNKKEELISITSMEQIQVKTSSIEPPPSQNVDIKPKVIEIKSLKDINIDLDTIQPSKEPPRIVLDEPQGMKIMLLFAKDHPRPDVTVIVISTVNQGPDTITNYQLEASVSKPCKLRLQDASGTNLPGIKPFRPAGDGIQQILLLSNSTTKPVNMTCILSYCVGDDPDPIRESIIVKDLPYNCE